MRFGRWKVCRTCLDAYPRDYFHRVTAKSSQRDQRNTQCKDCFNAAKRRRDASPRGDKARSNRRDAYWRQKRADKELMERIKAGNLDG